MLRFETCDKEMALNHLKKFYPSKIVEENNPYVAKVLSYVVLDEVRIPDPDFHPNGAVFPSNNWKSEKQNEIIFAFKEMVSNLPERK